MLCYVAIYRSHASALHTTRRTRFPQMHDFSEVRLGLAHASNVPVAIMHVVARMSRLGRCASNLSPPTGMSGCMRLSIVSLQIGREARRDWANQYADITAETVLEKALQRRCRLWPSVVAGCGRGPWLGTTSG